MTWLVLDIGSSSIRALLFDQHARLLPQGIISRSHCFHSDGAGASTASPQTLRALAEACLDEALQHPAAQQVRAVGMASFAGNWLGLDASGSPCTPLITYSDSSSHAAVSALRARLAGDEHAYHQATGCMLHPAYLPAQFAHWARAASAPIAQIGSIGGYLYRQWFKQRIPMSYSIASWTGLLDATGCHWHETYAHLLSDGALPPLLPALSDYDQVLCGLRGSYARRWSALRDTPFFLAIGDGAAANVGSGAVDGQHIALTLGTTAALRAVQRGGALPAGLWRYWICAGMPLVGGATSEGGNVYQWLRETLSPVGIDAPADAQLLGRAPDSHGLTVLPLLAGERSPGWQPHASGTIHGLRRHSSPLDLLQAHLEAVALRLSLIFHALHSKDAAIMAAGGALQASPAWAQILANALNAPLRLLAEAEITARGVCLLMRHSLDGTALLAQAPAIAAELQPDPAAVPIMRAARQRQMDLYQRLYGDAAKTFA